MWKLTIVLWAAAAFFDSMAIGQPTENDPECTMEAQLDELKLVFINRTLDKVNNRYAEVYRQILNRGALNPKTTEAITSKYITKLRVNLQILGPLVDDLILSGGNNAIIEKNCRSFYESYMKAAVDGINNVTKEAPSQPFRKLFLEFAKMWAEVKADLAGLPEKVYLSSTAVITEFADVSTSYYKNFNSRTEQFLVDHERLFNGTAIEEIVRQEFDAIIDAVPDVIEKTYECVMRWGLDDLSKVPIE